MRHGVDAMPRPVPHFLEVFLAVFLAAFFAAFLAVFFAMIKLLGNEQACAPGSAGQRRDAAWRLGR